MHLEQLRELLTKAERFYQTEREPSIFALGGRGYYENPTTDLLAFFLDPAQAHGLEECFLSALLNCLPNASDLSPSLRSAPKREVMTHKSNRIDLVLPGDGWDLILENKIFHGQINPFADYEAFTQRELNDGERPLVYVVLSPSGKSSQAAWYGLSYAKFIAVARQQLAQRMLSHPVDKWQVFARDFLLHLENITVEKAMDSKAVNFVIEHMHQINKLTRLKDQVIDALDAKVLEKLETEVAGYERYTRRHNWKNGPALRYASNQWETWSDVVLYLKGTDGFTQPAIWVYLCDVDEPLQALGRQLFSGNEASTWIEGKNNNILGFSWALEHFDEEEVLSLIVEKMKLLMIFETELRPQFSEPSVGGLTQ
ncbi:PD-(D/E)XK nuclease family protein [Ectopseudomonas mendocina]|uniref:PD-(D/E)XK nuclease family protein n=1 Tax=Ectopseudomonas mendocina TaxID=300 RepID=A0ABZ2RHD8_ECTME